MVVGHPGHPEADSRADGHLGQGHAQATTGHVMDALDQTFASGHDRGHQIGDEPDQAPVAGQVERGRVPLR